MLTADDNIPQQLRETNHKLAEENRLIKSENQLIQSRLAQFEAENAWLKEQLGLARKRQFGPSSEKTPPGQESLLFNEAEVHAAPEADEPLTETIIYTRTRRKQPGLREKQLAALGAPEQIFYELSEEEQICPECAGHLHRMGEDVRSEIKIVPAVITHVQHICGLYACRHCQNHEIKTPILSAPRPIAAFPNSLASPSAVAHIMTQKFVMAAPLYRQEQEMQRLGFPLSRQTMANWMLVGADWLKRIYERMWIHLLGGDIAHADETPLQVLHEEGRAAQTKSTMWLYRSGREGPPIVLYEYQPTRAAEHPQRFLKGFAGYLHVDGYAAYEGLAGITLVGCLAHARRKFVEAINVLPTPTRKKGGTPAHAGLDFCDRLFAIERTLQDVTSEERYAARDIRSRAVLTEFSTWLEQMQPQVLPKSKLGEAIGYCRNQWSKLTAFLLDGRLEIDNNRSERSIKVFVIGRKNWLFANTPRGAQSSALIYSLVETAKENGLNPYRYLTYLFESG